MSVVQFTAESPYLRRARRAAPSHRLFCLPFAGAGASAYRDWPDALPAHIEVVAIQLPGREDRIRDRPFTRIEPLARAVAQVVRPYLDLPAVFFGHSSGGLLAYEVMRVLAGRLPADGPDLRLIVSGCPHPRRRSIGRPVADLPEDELVAEIAALNGTAVEVVDNPQLLALVVPALRADAAMAESYRFRAGALLPWPVTVFGGESDPHVDPADLAGWDDYTSAPSQVRLFPGGHFFLNESAAAVHAAIASELT
ncbi:alpha/beta fold hydrolase [Micromonospora sp. NPDC049891]|uniref:thioesterase II family protein n=1 Tax=Micromonospora sp. NPDC049891 TaxID=3155655 RepID=UPI0033DF4DF1